MWKENSPGTTNYRVLDITLCYYLQDTVSDFIYLLVGCHSDDQFHILHSIVQSMAECRARLGTARSLD